MIDAKHVAAVSLAKLLPYYFRHAPATGLSERIWSDICADRINWRNISLVSDSSEGIHFHCLLRDAIQCYIHYFGTWEPHITRYVKRSIRPGDTFIDIGANIGYYSLLAAKLGAVVVAIEASHSIFKRLRGNIGLNNARGIRAVNAAIGYGSDVAELFLWDDSNIGKTTLLKNRTDNSGRVETVRMTPLLPILGEDERRTARLVKIDVEGAESPILREICRNLEAFPERMEIVSEISPEGLREYGSSIDALLHEFERRGYHPYSIRNDYGPGDYIGKLPPQPPKRLTTVPSSQIDILFSRRNEACL